MSAEEHISETWKAWLADQTNAQLESSLGSRERTMLGSRRACAWPTGLHNDKEGKCTRCGSEVELSDESRIQFQREIRMIRAELLRRAETANATRADFFPRIKLRNAADAALLAQLLHAHTVEVMEHARTVMQAKDLRQAGFPLEVTFTDPMTGDSTTDMDQVLHDLVKRTISVTELAAEVAEEFMRLKREDGVTLSESEAKAFDEIAKLVQNLGGETEK